MILPNGFFNHSPFKSVVHSNILINNIILHFFKFGYFNALSHSCGGRRYSCYPISSSAIGNVWYQSNPTARMFIVRLPDFSGAIETKLHISSFPKNKSLLTLSSAERSHHVASPVKIQHKRKKSILALAQSGSSTAEISVFSIEPNSEG